MSRNFNLPEFEITPIAKFIVPARRHPKRSRRRVISYSPSLVLCTARLSRVDRFTLFIYPSPRRAPPLRTFRTTRRSAQPLKSLILAGINEFPEESRGITLPRERRRRQQRRRRAHAILQVGIESTSEEKGWIRSSRGKCFTTGK